MTAIAFADGMLAADRGLFSGSHVILGLHPKIKALPGGWYVASSGNFADGLRAERMFKRNHRPELNEFKKLGESCDGILIGPTKGKAWVFTSTAGLEPVVGPQAFGACEDFLFGAMAAGLDARRAVETACKHHALAIGPVDWVQCWPKARAVRKSRS